MKEQFINLYNTNIKREGAKELLAWLQKADFFTAPASTKYHLSTEGGLLEHSLNVYNRLLELVKNENLKRTGSSDIDEKTLESVTICSLLHDVCKVNFYKVAYRNHKNEATKKWEQIPYYTIEDKFAYGHGEKSVFLIERFMRLSIEEAVAIRWHMGGFDEAVKGGSYALNAAWAKYPLPVLLHIADLMASNLDEVGR